MKRYTLYLDESETHRYNNITRKNEDFYFCMAGIIIPTDDIPKLENNVIQLKKNVWSEYQNPENIILHQMRILEAEKGHLDATSFPEYVKFRRVSERRKFYDELKEIFMSNDITIIGCSINEDRFKDFYHIANRNSQDQYLVAMQLLLENYCHFLCNNNGVGNIVYEYRELIGNESLRNKYYHMKLMGSMYMTRKAAEKRLLGMDFDNKNKNIAGLQIADFVPNSFARDHSGKGQSNPNIFSTLKYHRYDGNQNMADRFGIKYMP